MKVSRKYLHKYLHTQANTCLNTEPHASTNHLFLCLSRHLPASLPHSLTHHGERRKGSKRKGKRDTAIWQTFFRLFGSGVVDAWRASAWEEARLLLPLCRKSLESGGRGYDELVLVGELYTFKERQDGVVLERLIFTLACIYFLSFLN